MKPPENERRPPAAGPGGGLEADQSGHHLINPNGSTELLHWALSYGAAGWSVFPLQPRDKRPYPGSRGLDDATTDLEVIERWWTERPDSNIAVRTGMACDVLDLDGEAAEAAFDAYQLERDLPMPGDHDWPEEPLWAVTAKGLHCFVQPTGAGNRTGLLGSSIDWRGARGYAVVPPSVHPTGVVYEWIHEWRPQPPACPPWLAELVIPKVVQTPPSGAPRRLLDPLQGDGTAYGRAALQAECERLAAATPGARNDTLNTAAFSLYRLVAGGELEASFVERCLLAAAEMCGLGGREIVATIRSAARKGLLQPRRSRERVA